MNKRLFQILDEINVMDIKNGTSYVQICGQQNVISVDKRGDHGEVKIGIPSSIPIEIMQGNDLRIMLCIIDGETYDKLSKS